MDSLLIRSWSKRLDFFLKSLDLTEDAFPNDLLGTKVCLISKQVYDSSGPQLCERLSSTAANGT